MSDFTKFPVDGRSGDEVNEMHEYGYVEIPAYKEGASEEEGYFCATCKFHESRPMSMPENASEDDGYCKQYDFKDRRYGCCNGWTP